MYRNLVKLNCSGLPIELASLTCRSVDSHRIASHRIWCQIRITDCNYNLLGTTQLCCRGATTSVLGRDLMPEFVCPCVTDIAHSLSISPLRLSLSLSLSLSVNISSDCCIALVEFGLLWFCWVYFSFNFCPAFGLWSSLANISM